MSNLVSKATVIKITAILGLTIIAFVNPVHAQKASGSATLKPKLSYPIAELGRCTSTADCKAYCDIADHQTECIAFAKKKGFYKEKTATPSASVLKDAEAALGCTSPESCKLICEATANREKCQDFAEKHNLKPPKSEEKSDILTKAKSELGCTSPDSCKVLCADPANKDKCSTFAKENGLKGGLSKSAQDNDTLHISSNSAKPTGRKLESTRSAPSKLGEEKKPPTLRTNEERGTASAGFGNRDQKPPPPTSQAKEANRTGSN